MARHYIAIPNLKRFYYTHPDSVGAGGLFLPIAKRYVLRNWPKGLHGRDDAAFASGLRCGERNRRQVFVILNAFVQRRSWCNIKGCRHEPDGGNHGLLVGDAK